MSIQILDIVLYSPQGERRVLSLRPGEVNVITGEERTGKSALISIVDYCFGSPSCSVPSGTIQNNVAWYALRITDGNTEHFIARRAPEQGQRASSSAYYIVGSSLNIPNANELSARTNIDTIVERLKDIIGIRLHIHEPPEGQTRPPLTTTFRHALAFVFQPQNEISQPGFLFHNQNSNWVAQAIKDNFPYFLGAVEDDFVASKARLKELRSSLRDRERTLARLESLASGRLSEVSGLLTEAYNIGLLDQNVAPESWDEAIEILRIAISTSPEEQIIRYEESIDQAELIRLNEVRSSLRQQLAREQGELNAMRELLVNESGFTQESHEQLSRLRSLNLFRNFSEPHCPLCDQPTNQLPSPDLLQREINRVSEQLEGVARQTPGLEALILRQEEQINITKQRLHENRIAREALQRIDEQLNQLRDDSVRRAYVIGRISLFLENLPQISDNSELRSEITQLQGEIDQLNTSLSDENIQENLNHILSLISRDLTEWSNRLHLEYQGNPFRLDLRYLQIVTDTSDEIVPMHRMGSGSNWLGCHLIAHLALHKWFIQQSRPVPHFLFLDQPSQVYYPRDRAIVSSLENLEDAERAAVTRMFELIRDVVRELHPGFQVIITEHADLSEDWYQEAVVERWRNGNALIPVEWTANGS